MSSRLLVLLLSYSSKVKFPFLPKHAIYEHERLFLDGESIEPTCAGYCDNRLGKAE